MTSEMLFPVTEPAMLETILKQEKRVVAAGLVFLTALAWLYLFHLHRAMALPMAGMADMAGMMMPMARGWTRGWWASLDYS